MAPIVLTGIGLAAAGLAGLRGGPRRLRYAFMVCVPLGVGLIVFRNPIAVSVVGGCIGVAVWLYNL